MHESNNYLIKMFIVWDEITCKMIKLLPKGNRKQKHNSKYSGVSMVFNAKLRITVKKIFLTYLQENVALEFCSNGTKKKDQIWTGKMKKKRKKRQLNSCTKRKNWLKPRWSEKKMNCGNVANLFHYIFFFNKKDVILHADDLKRDTSFIYLCL